MFGEILNKTRKSKGLTAQQMADFLGVQLRSYRAYESKDRQPSFAVLVKIADRLNVTTDYLLCRISSCEVFEKHVNSDKK